MSNNKFKINERVVALICNEPTEATVVGLFSYDGKDFGYTVAFDHILDNVFTYQEVELVSLQEFERDE